jgi:transposase
MPEGLQLIIGADNKNEFSLHKNSKENKIYVYFGIGLFEVVENNKDNPELKLLLARLYNSGVKVKTLIEHFGYSYPTYKHWGDALKSGDEERIYYALSGQGGGSKKLKPEIVAFIVHDFSHVYPRNKYSYSKEIREDIKDIYNLDLSAECIRPLLGKLKKSYSKNQGLTEEEKKSIYKSYID